ncbi:hypothetical protein [Exiguobacterium sp. s55]|uniref:hypothetical protein n=1 Tax=Exiguobacterium sp. s55 TaxID=2751245 RepID=UPI001BE4ECD5|nr:hypothetical protein [Exiguobacterium sp. s55]
MFNIIQTAIFITLLLSLLTISLAKFEKSIIYYIIFCLISPNLILGDTTITFEIVAFLFYIPIVIVKRREIFVLKKVFLFRQLFLLIPLIAFISSLIAEMKYGSNLNVIALFGYLRIIILIWVLQYCNEKLGKDYVLDKILSLVILINIIVSLIQLLNPSSVDLFYNFYFRPSLTPLEEVMYLGYFNRAYGTFGSPVLLGVFSVFAFSFYLVQIAGKKQQKFLISKLLGSTILGLMALSKSAILGIPLLLLLAYGLMLIGFIKLNNSKFLILPLVSLPTVLIIIYVLKQMNTSILWYTNYLTNPLAAFDTRYSLDSGILISTYSTIKENLVFGVGLTVLNGDFLGDSMYTTILYTIGLVGSMIYVIFFTLSFVISIYNKKIASIIMLVSILLMGFSLPVHLELMTVPFFAYIFSELEDRERKMTYDILLVRKKGLN